MKWVIVNDEGEFHVSDGKVGERTVSFSFTSQEEAKELKKELLERKGH